MKDFPAEIASLPQPWLRLAPKQGKGGTSESSKAYAAFELYYQASPDQRSLRQTALQLGRSETLVERWSTRFFWVARSDAWDRQRAKINADVREEKLRQRAEEWESRMDETLENGFKGGRALFAAGVQNLKLPASNRSLAGATRAMQTGHEMSFQTARLALRRNSGGSPEDEYEFTLRKETSQRGNEK